ncbi:MAG TPA: Gfo/Idh/MocA family oxidoreductase [Terriglobales bacterium]|nr:Gfo/Idh/MocA family oxidoreductase [Terriglobales bacterium]
MTIKIGLIGGGSISETHARAAREIPGVEITAVYGTNADKVARLCQQYGGSPFPDLVAFLAHRPMDLVIIGSPSGLHAAQGIEAARRGLHILTEKPIDISTERTDALIEAAQKNGVKLGVIFQDRLKPDIRRLREKICAGKLGRITLIDARVKWYRPPEYYGKSRWRGTFEFDGGGALMNQGVHTVDLLLWLFGDAVNVQSRVQTALHAIEVEDTAVAILEFAGGALCTLEATTAAYPGYPRRVEITGSEGTVILEDDRIVTSELRSSRDAIEQPDRPKDEGAASHVVNDIRGHQAVLEDFIHAIEHNGTPACDGQEGRKSVALIEAIYRAARK